MQIFGREHHHHDNPWDGAPPWAIELGCLALAILTEIQLSKEAIMAAIDDLKTAVAGFITEGTSDIAALVAQINAASGNDPAIVALTQQVTDATTAMHTAFTSATGTPLPPPAA